MPRLILWYTVQEPQHMWELGEEADLDHLCEGEGGRERGREGGRERERECVCVSECWRIVLKRKWYRIQLKFTTDPMQKSYE